MNIIHRCSPAKVGFFLSRTSTGTGVNVNANVNANYVNLSSLPELYNKPKRYNLGWISLA